MWTKPNFQDLSRHDEISIDTETDGLNCWDGARTIGVSISTGDKSFYYAYGHKTGNSHTKREVFDYLRREISGKTLICFNGKFDLLMLLVDGLDLRNNKLKDSYLAAPLCNEFEPKFSLNALSQAKLGHNKLDIDVTNLKNMDASKVGPYAEQDAKLHYDLYKYYEKEIERLELQDVYNLECRVLPAVVEMEYNGMPIDEEKLHRYKTGVRKDLEDIVKQLADYSPQTSFLDTGVDYNSSKWMEALFKQENLPFLYNWDCSECKGRQQRYVAPINSDCPICENKGEISSKHFGEMIYTIKHPAIQLAKMAKKFDRLLNNFIIPWERYPGILRYQLNQLRGDEYGTISGRFSANGFEGAQPQQIWKLENQKEEMGDKYLLRELFYDDKLYACDASQIEYRMFGMYSGSKAIISAYNDDPNTDYHQFIADNVFRGKLSRSKAKHPNFGLIYGLGIAGLAKRLKCTYNEAKEIYAMYDEVIPEAKRTINKMKARAAKRGYVRTLYGRRREFPNEKFAYKAVNAVIQGSAADVMKEGIANVYENRLGLLRLTVHDELVGRTQSDKETQQIKECLENFKGPPNMKPLKIPLLWDMEVGDTWR